MRKIVLSFATLAIVAFAFTLLASSSNSNLKFLNRVEVFEPVVEMRGHRWANSFNQWQEQRLNRNRGSRQAAAEAEPAEAEPLEAAEPGMGAEVEPLEAEPQAPRRGARAPRTEAAQGNRRNRYVRPAEVEPQEPVEAEPQEPAAGAGAEMEPVEREPAQGGAAEAAEAGAEAGAEENFEAANYGWGVELPAKTPVPSTRTRVRSEASEVPQRGANRKPARGGARPSAEGKPLRARTLRVDPFTEFDSMWLAKTSPKTSKTGFQAFGGNLYQYPANNYFGGNYEQQEFEHEGYPLVSESALCQMRCQRFDQLLREHTHEFCQGPLYQNVVSCINDQNARTLQMTSSCNTSCPRA